MTCQKLIHGVSIYINDINFDLNNTAVLILKDADGNVLYEGELEKLHLFDDYGTVIFKDAVWDEKGQEAISNQTVYYYEVVVSDIEGHKTVATYTKDDFINGQSTMLAGDTGDEPEEIENPKTSATDDNFLFSLILLIISALLLYKKMQMINY